MYVLLVIFLLFGAPAALAQNADTAAPASSFVLDLAKEVVLDPTTWAPASISFAATRLDWNSSQVFFRHGVLERNARFTVTGTSPGVPVTYGKGNRKILADTLWVLQMSAVHNVSQNVIERLLVKRYPDKRRLLRTIGWIERAAFASYWSHRFSAAHFRQWQENERMARALGYK